MCGTGLRPARPQTHGTIPRVSAPRDEIGADFETMKRIHFVPARRLDRESRADSPSMSWLGRFRRSCRYGADTCSITLGSRPTQYIEKVGWGARIRTWEWRNQNPMT